MWGVGGQPVKEQGCESYISIYRTRSSHDYGNDYLRIEYEERLQGARDDEGGE